MQRRCRFCRTPAPGAEVPVWSRGSDKRERWHLCGRCWGFLELGLRAAWSTGVESLVDGELQLQASDVRAAIRSGSQPGLDPANEWGRHLDPEVRRLLMDLEVLVREIEASAYTREAAGVWRWRRARIAECRERLRALRNGTPVGAQSSNGTG